MTEIEAREKWCPQTRAIYAGQSFNRLGEMSEHHLTADLNPAPRRCIASDCMAWRWGGRDKGHCGLAGKP